MKDASQNAIVAAKLLDNKEKKSIKHLLDDKYEHLREDYIEEQQKIISIEEARKNKLNLFN